MKPLNQLKAIFIACLLSLGILAVAPLQAGTNSCTAGKAKRVDQQRNGTHYNYCKISTCRTIGAQQGWATVTGNFPATTLDYTVLTVVDGSDPVPACPTADNASAWTTP